MRFSYSELVPERWTKMATVGTRENGKSRTRLIAIYSISAFIFLTLIVYAFGHLPAPRNKERYESKGASPALEEALPPAPPAITKIATIIENRPLANLVPLVLAFSAVLGPGWPIKIFHGPQNKQLFDTSPSMQRMMESGQVTLELLPDGLNFTSHEPVSAFFATPWLWEHLAPAKHVLMFQTDSILCANSLRRVDDFLEYDFIGAPIKVPDGVNYNGGLCLRNREKILEVLQHFTRPHNGNFEDQWFAQKLRELPKKPNGEPGAHLPTLEVASEFSVETIWKDKPFGMHQISRWHSEKLAELKSWCPEYQLAIEGGLHPFHNKDIATLDVGLDKAAGNNPDVVPFPS
ncbi:MAG: hypothetical protein L6R40_005083 [Gallowayella cf. fulva]|nr:MAG: hypothetical protein L6R40_005083 [Xanthomendoza cf. fulva]